MNPSERLLEEMDKVRDLNPGSKRTARNTKAEGFLTKPEIGDQPLSQRVVGGEDSSQFQNDA